MVKVGGSINSSSSSSGSTTHGEDAVEVLAQQQQQQTEVGTGEAFRILIREIRAEGEM